MLKYIWKALVVTERGWLEEYYDRHGLANYSAAEEAVQTWIQAQRALAALI